MSELLGERGIETVKENIPCPEIQADTLEEVVLFCIKWLEGTNGVFLIDDSGLFIDALHGFPGVYSAYAFKTIGNDGILRLMENVPEGNRTAHFETVFALGGAGETLLFRGDCSGKIADKTRGTDGFGYDPIFIADDGDGRTFGEMSVAEKNEISHRGRAVRKMMENADRILQMLREG